MSEDEKPITVVTPAPPADAEVERVPAVVISIIPPPHLKDATLEEIKLAFVDEMEGLLNDISQLIWVNFRTQEASSGPP